MIYISALPGIISRLQLRNGRGFPSITREWDTHLRRARARYPGIKEEEVQCSAEWDMWRAYWPEEACPGTWEDRRRSSGTSSDDDIKPPVFYFEDVAPQRAWENRLLRECYPRRQRYNTSRDGGEYLRWYCVRDQHPRELASNAVHDIERDPYWRHRSHTPPSSRRGIFLDEEGRERSGYWRHRSRTPPSSNRWGVFDDAVRERSGYWRYRSHSPQPVNRRGGRQPQRRSSFGDLEIKCEPLDLPFRDTDNTYLR